MGYSYYDWDKDDYENTVLQAEMQNKIIVNIGVELCTVKGKANIIRWAKADGYTAELNNEKTVVIITLVREVK